MRGESPSAIACAMSVNAPEISACEAMIVAIVATTTIGTSVTPGVSA
jgi:hypothetical protein